MLTPVLITLVVLVGLVIFRFHTIGDAPARHFARSEYERIAEEDPGDVLVSIDKDRFVEIFDRLRVRRFWAHFVLFWAIAIASSTVLMMALGVMWRYFNPGFYVWGFIAIFTYVAVAVVSLFVTLRLYTNNLWPAMRKAIESKSLRAG